MTVHFYGENITTPCLNDQINLIMPMTAQAK